MASGRNEPAILGEKQKHLILDVRNKKYMSDIKKRIKKGNDIYLSYNKIFLYLLAVIEPSILENDYDKNTIKTVEPMIREVLKK